MSNRSPCIERCKPVVPRVASLTGAALLCLAPFLAAAEDAKPPQANMTEIRKNNAVVKEITKPGSLVEGEDGSKHAATGPAKPVETWLSACPPHKGGDSSSNKVVANDKVDCRKPGDRVVTVPPASEPSTGADAK